MFKKVIKKFNKSLYVLLTAAMVVGSTPDVCLTASAAELDTAITADSTAVDTANVGEEIVANGTSTITAPSAVDGVTVSYLLSNNADQSITSDTKFETDNLSNIDESSNGYLYVKLSNKTGYTVKLQEKAKDAGDWSDSATVSVDDTDNTYYKVTVSNELSLNISAVANTYTVTNSATGYVAIDSGVSDGNATYGTDLKFTVANTSENTVTAVSVTIGEQPYEFGSSNKPAEGVVGAYTIPGTAILGAIEISVTTQAVPEPPVEANTVALTSNSNEKVDVEAAFGSYNVNATTLDYNTITKSASTLAGEEEDRLYVRVKKIDDVDINVSDGSEVAEDDTYVYFKTNECYGGACEVEVTATVDVNVTVDDDANYESIAFEKHVDTLSSSTIASDAVSITIDHVDNAGTLTYGETYDVTITTKSGVVLKSMKVGSTVKYADADSSGSSYKFTSAVTANKAIDLYVTAAKSSVVTLDGNANVTIKYADNAKLDGVKSYTNGTIAWSGDLYIQADANTGYRIDKVEAITLDSDGEEVAQEITATGDGKNIYKVSVSEATKLKFTVVNTYAVTAGIKSGNADIDSWSWSLDPKASFTKYVAETASTHIPALAEGEKVYFKVALKSGVEGKAVKVTANDTPIEPLEKTNATADDIYEITMGVEVVAVEFDTVDATATKYTVTFPSISADNYAKIKTFEYKLSTDSQYKTVEATGEESAKQYQITEIPANAWLYIRVTLTDEAKETKYVKTIAGQTATDGVARFKVSAANDSATIEFGDYKKVTVTDVAATDKDKYTVQYRIGTTGDYQDLTANVFGAETKTGIKVEEGKDVYLKITGKDGYAIKTVTGATTTTTEGTYKIAAIATDTDVTVAVEDSVDVTFTVDKKKVVGSVEYKLDAAAEQSGAISGTSLTIGNKDKDPAVVSVKAEKLALGTDKNIYFKLNAYESAVGVVKEVKLNGEVIKADANGNYKIPFATFAENKTATVEIVTTAQYIVTYDASANQGRSVEVKTVGKTPQALATTNVNVGDELKFTVTYPSNTDAKLDKVVYVTKDAKNKDVETPVPFTTSTDANVNKITNTYTLKPEVSGTLKVVSHDRSTVGVTFNFANATVKAGTAKESISASVTSGTAYTSAKEDQTVYFTVDPATLYKVTSVTQKVTVDEETKEKPLTAVDGVYSLSLEDITAAQIITINTERDAQKNNSLVFTADLDAVTIEYDTDKEVDSSKKILFADTSQAFTVKVNPGYKVKSVNLGKEEDEDLTGKDFETGGTFTVSGFTAMTGAADEKPGSKTITIVTEKEALTADKFVTITGSYDSFDFENATYYRDDAWNTAYKVAKGETDVKFSIVVDSELKPTVKYNDTVVVKPLSGPTKVSDTKVEYKYSIVASAISGGLSAENPAEIDVATAPVDPTKVNSTTASIKVAKVFDDVTPTVKLVGKDKWGDEYSQLLTKTNNAEYTTYSGTNLTKGHDFILYAYVPAGYALSSDLKGFAFYGVENNKNVYKAYIADLNEAIEAVITPSMLTDLSVTKNDEPVEPVKGVYSASKNDAFAVTILQGNKAAAFTEATVSGVEATDAIANANGVATLTIPEKAAGKTITFTVKYMENGEEKTASYKISVAKAVSKVTVKGVKNDALTQIIDTTASYQISGAKDFSVLYAEVSEASTGFTMEAPVISSKGELVITTPKTEGSATITIKSTAETETTKEENGTETTVNKTLATFKLTAQKPVLKLKKANATVVLDAEATFAVTADASTVKTNTNKLQYKFVITPSASYKDDTTKPTGAETKTVMEDVAVKDGKLVLSQNVTLDLSTAPGKAWEYKVAVSLVEMDGSTVVAESAAIEKTIVTKNPYYEDKMSLSKKTTTIYTGQEDILVAVPKFGKKTTYQDIKNNADVEIYNADGTVFVNTPQNESYGEYIHAWWDEQGIKVSVGAGMRYKKATSYTLKVIPDSGKTNDTDSTNLYAAPATLKITVVQGIYSVYMNPSNTNIYKQSNKAVTYTTQVVYNGNSSNSRPKTAKATFEVGRLDKYGNFVADQDLAKLITVKNGKITISKNYKVSDDPADNVFTVKVKAADYSGNETSSIATYTVTTEKAQFGKMYAAKVVDGKYYVTDSNSFTTDEYSDIEFIVLKPGVEEGRSYYTYDDLVDSNDYTLTYSKSRYKVGNNIVATATAKDGSKVKATYKFNTVYNKAAAIGIKEFLNDANNGCVAVVKTGDRQYTFNSASVDDTIEFYVGYKENASDTAFKSISSQQTFNYNVTVKGGKILSSNKNYGWYRVVPTAKNVVITVQDKTNKKAVNTVYTLTNKSYTTAKAPKVTVKSDNIYVNTWGNVKLTIDPSAYDAVYITRDVQDYYKHSGQYNYLYGLGVHDLDTTDKSVYWIGVDGKYAGTYKLNVTFGTWDVDDNFVPQTKPVAVKFTVKAAAAYKPTTRYTMDEKIGYVTLAGKPAEYTWVYDCAELLNANVGGQPNEFTKYFSIDRITHTESEEVIYDYSRLKLNKKSDGKLYTAAEIPAKDLTGYVSYCNPKTDTMEYVKITVKFKANAYKASAVSVMADKDKKVTAQTVITNGKSTVDLASVYAVSEKLTGITATVSVGNKVTITATGVEPGKYDATLYVLENNAGNVELSATNYETAGTPVKVTITVTDPAKGKVKFDSKALKVTFEEGDYTPGTLTWDKNVSYKVVVTGADVATTGTAFQSDVPSYLKLAKGDGNFVTVTVDKAALATAEAANTTSKSLYGATGKYKADIAFTNGTTEVVTFTVTTPKKPQTFAEAVAVIKAAESKELADFVFVNEELGNIPDVTPDTTIAKANIELYANYLISKESGAVVTVTEIAKQVATSATENGYYIAKLTVTNTDKNNTDTAYTSENLYWEVYVDGEKPQTLNQAWTDVMLALSNAYGSNQATNDITEAAVLAVAKSAVKDERIDVRIVNFNVVEATEGNVGYVSGTVRLSRSIWNRMEVAFGKSGTGVDVSIDIPALIQLTGVSAKVVEELAKTKSGYSGTDPIIWTNAVTEKDVLDLAKSVINNPAISVAFKADAEGATTPANAFHKTPASATTVGYVQGTLVFSQDDKTDVELTLSSSNNEIKKWNTADTTATSAIKTYLENTANFKATNATTATEIIAAAKKAIHDPEDKLTITVAKKANPATEDDFTKKEATITEDGSIKLKLVVTDKANSATTATTAEITLTIDKLPQTLAEAKTAVEKVIDEVGKTATKDTAQSAFTSEFAKVVSPLYGVDVTKYTVTAPTTEKDGTIEISVKIKVSGFEVHYVVVNKTISLAKLPATTS